MTLREPASNQRPGAARWAAYLDWLRDDLVRAVLALSPEEQRTSTVPSGCAEDGTPPDLEWICFHVFFEYARHLGQLDVAVEVAPSTN